MITVYIGAFDDDFNFLQTHITMPADEDSIKNAFHEIGVDIENGGDYVVKSFRSAHEEINRRLNKSDSILEVNTLARALSEMDVLDRDKLNAACVLRNCGGVDEILHIAANLDDYDYLPADSDEALGEFELETGRWDVPDGLMDYIDCAKLGRETRLRQGGMFMGMGYIYEIPAEVAGKDAPQDYGAPGYTDESEDEEWER